MSETDPKLQALEDAIKALPDDVRLAFLSRQMGHAVVNPFPEGVRDAADKATAFVDEQTTGTAFEAVGNKVETFLQTMKDLWAHKVGKVLFFVAAAIIVLLVIRMLSG